MTAKQLGIVLLLCGLAQSCQCQKVPSANVTAPTDTGWVNGSVAAAVTDAKRFRLIDLPGVTVQLRRAADEQLVATAVTDRAGSYVIGPQPSGRYQLCWQAPGFVPGCSKQLVDIRGTIFYPPTLELTPLGRALFGRVTLRDGRLCNYRDRAFDVDAHAQVTVLNAAEKPVAPSVDTNGYGEYVLAGVPLGHFAVRIACELSSATVVAQTTSAEHTKLDLMLPNSSPEISTLALTAGGRGVYRVRPGDTVHVTAKALDVDSDPLEYRWFANGGTFTSHDDGTVDWKLTGGPGLNTMYLLVSDGKGGYASDRVEVLTAADTQLGGQVVDEVGVPIGEAIVSIDGANVRTDAQGHFQLSLQGNEDRHVLTIAKDQYQTVSRIVQGPLTGGDGRFRLSRARTFVVDPALGISILDPRKGLRQRGAEISIAPNSLAPVADGRRATAEPLVASITTMDPADPDNGIPGDGSALNARGERVWMESLGAVEVEFRDAAGNLYNLIKGRTATVRIPVEPERARRGDLPSSVPVWFYDAASGLWREDGLARLAGDFYEAVVKHFSIIDIGYSGPNVTCARVRTSQMMVSRGYITMPYDITVNVFRNGMLDKTKTAPIDNPLSAIVNLPVSNNADSYTVTVQALNADHTPNTRFKAVTFRTDTEAAGTPTYPFDSCRSVTAGLIQGLGLGGRVDVDFATREPSDDRDGTPGGFLTFRFGQGSFATAAQYYAKIDPTVAQGSGTVTCPYNSTTVTGLSTSFTTFFKAGDIIDCDVGQLQHEQRTVQSVDTDVSLTVWTPFTAQNGHTGVAYNRVGSKTNFGAWKTANGFVNGQPPDAEAIYFNNGDLGFGRWMNMKRQQANSIAFYVSNFKDADKAIAYRNGDLNAGLIATVAMEYSPISDPLGSPITKFYVFNKDGVRVDFADLDGNGAKFVPHLCVICHGGSVPQAPAEPPADLSARFIGFDLRSFAYSSNPQWTRAVQEAQFKTLNQRVRDTVPNGCDPNYQGDYRTICALIDGWYDGGSPTQMDNFVPAVTCPSCTPQELESWQSNPDAGALYNNVVPYCRSCHSTRTANLDWGTYSLFRFRRDSSSGIDGGNIQGRVCGQPTSPYNGRNMPQASRTWYSFWTSAGPAPDFSPHAPFVLRDALQILCTPPWPDAGTP